MLTFAMHFFDFVVFFCYNIGSSCKASCKVNELQMLTGLRAHYIPYPRMESYAEALSFSQTNISESDWGDFADYIADNVATVTSNEDEKNFLTEYLMGDAGYIPSEIKHTMIISMLTSNGANYKTLALHLLL